MQSKKVLFISPILGLSLILVGCSSNTETPTVTAQETETTKAVVVRAEPGATYYQDTSTSIADENPLNGVLKYPGGQVTILGSGSVSGVPLEEGDLPTDVNWESESVAAPPEEKLPAEGEHFVAYRLKFDMNTEVVNDTPYFAVVIDGTTRELSDLATEGERVLVLSIPESTKDVILETRFDGLVQKLDLTTGDRLSDTAPALYTGASNGTLPSGGMIHSETPGSIGTVTFDAAVGSVYRAAWWNELHWANNGDDAWIVVNLSTTPTWRYQASRIASIGDNQETWTLTDQSGNVYSPIPNALNDSSILVFQVPSDSTNFELSVTGQGQSWDGTQRDAMVSIAAPPVALTF